MATTTISLYELAKRLFPQEKLVLAYMHGRKDQVTVNNNRLNNIIRHYQQATTHRAWLYMAFTLVRDSFKLKAQLRLYNAVLHHDLSKFSGVETLGYAIKFGRKNPKIELKNPKDIALWEAGLQHHYDHNKHHPPQGKCMGYYDLIESVLDMLACRMERNLYGQPGVITADIFNVPLTYLDRYTDTDKEIVACYLRAWCADVVSTPHRDRLAISMLH